jgi:hypothetical protein
MRRERGGPVVERIEPLEQIIVPAAAPLDGWGYNPGNRPWIREALYAHYQGEKYERAHASAVINGLGAQG